MYTFLTTLIILLGKLRDRIPSSRSGGKCLRFDRCVPWGGEVYAGNYYLGCCDCGLEHFIVPYHSFTPVRPRRYAYHHRLGAKAWHEPDSSLTHRVYTEAKKAGVIK